MSAKIRECGIASFVTVALVTLGSFLTEAAQTKEVDSSSVTVPDNILYCNDFAARVSKSQIPAGQWFRYDYTVGEALANSYASSSYTYTRDMPWNTPEKMQDCWIGGGLGTWTPAFLVKTNLVNELPLDTDVPFGAFSLNSDDQFTGAYYHPIGNSFTNGILTCYVDMRAPRRWGRGASTSMIRFFPAFRTNLLNPDYSSNAPLYPMICGLQAKDEPSSTVRFMGFSENATGTGNLAGTFGDRGEIVSGCWYRFFMKMDLDSKKVEGSVRKLGNTVPRWDETGTDIHGVSQRYLYRHPTDETGPIEGIGFVVRGVIDRGVVTNMACVTNIRILWTPPGATEAIACYSNNFTTCWRRQVTAGTTTFTFPEAEQHADTDVFTAYNVIKHDSFPTDSGRIIPNSGGNKYNVEPIGLDGWRRINAAGVCNVSVVDSTGAAGPVMRISRSSNDSRFVGVAQTLGETIVSGKVRISVDARPPKQWDWTSSRGMYVCLGNASYYNDARTLPNDNITVSYCARIGLTSDSDTANPYPIFYSESGLQSIKTTNVAFRTWCRFVITADMDTKTYDWAIYDLGNGGSGKPMSFPTPEKPLASGSDVQFYNYDGWQELSSFALWAYGPCYNDFNGAILYDNIQVWKNWDGTSGDLIYSNDFSERRRAVYTDARKIADVHNVAMPESDFWVRRGGGAGAAEVVGETNPCAVFRDAAPVTIVHDLGETVDPTRHKKCEFRVDIRTPASWYATDAHASMLLGGDEFAQGDTFGGADILSRAALRVGFAASGSANVCGKRSSSKVILTNGGELYSPTLSVVASKWYRFVIKNNPASDEYSVSIYLQGNAQPASTDANGELVAAYENLSLATGASRKLTHVALATSGLGADSPYLADDPNRVLIDNLCVYKFPIGFMLILK